MYFQKLVGLGPNPFFFFLLFSFFPFFFLQIVRIPSDFMSSNFCYISLHKALSCGSFSTGRRDIFKHKITAVSIIRSLAEMSCYQTTCLPNTYALGGKYAFFLIKKLESKDKSRASPFLDKRDITHVRCWNSYHFLIMHIYHGHSSTYQVWMMVQTSKKAQTVIRPLKERGFGPDL